MSRKSVLFCTNPSLCSSIILNQLLQADNIEVVGVFLSTRTRTRKGNFLQDIASIISKSGFSYLIYLAFATVVFELVQIFRPGTFLPTTAKLASKNNIPVFKGKDINDPRAIDWLHARKPDYLLSGFFNLKLGDEALSVARLGSVNLHPSLLPEYKGVDPVFYYFLNKESTLGVTLHRMDKDYDTGEILAQNEIPRDLGRSVFWHNAELFRKGAKLFINWAEQPGKNLNLANTPVSENYDSWPDPEQVSQLKSQLYSWHDLVDQASRND